MPQLTTLIPSFAAPVTDRVWLVGAHGGAAIRTPTGSPTPAARCR
jgi:protein ImuA